MQDQITRLAWAVTVDVEVNHIQARTILHELVIFLLLITYVMPASWAGSPAPLGLPIYQAILQTD